MKVQQLYVVATFQSLTEQGSSDLGGAFILQGQPGAVVILAPRGVRQRHNDTCSVDAKLDVDSIAMAQRDCRLEIDELAVVILLR